MSKKVIGLDIGGSKVTGVVFDGKKILRSLTIVTPKNLFEFERNLIKLADFLSAGQKVSAIGAGMAGLVDSKKGIVKHSPNIKFVKNLSLAKLFKLIGYRAVKIDNDASCFTRAEMLLGRGKKFNNFLALTLGTGIGGGAVIKNSLFRGPNNAGAEFGHIVLADDFLEKHFQEFRRLNDYAKMGKILGRGLASLINIFTPEAIILGGSVSQNAGGRFLPAAKKEVNKFLFDKSFMPEIVFSKLKHAGALGAALLVA